MLLTGTRLCMYDNNQLKMMSPMIIGLWEPLTRVGEDSSIREIYLSPSDKMKEAV